jgi:hypothetical protein
LSKGQYSNIVLILEGTQGGRDFENLPGVERARRSIGPVMSRAFYFAANLIAKKLRRMMRLFSYFISSSQRPFYQTARLVVLET